MNVTLLIEYEGTIRKRKIPCGLEPCQGVTHNYMKNLKEHEIPNFLEGISIHINTARVCIKISINSRCFKLNNSIKYLGRK